ncbi:MAG: tail fiber domain-containing protein [Patescibacteria group bacterium]|jgi:hypothetical protein
MSPKKTLKNYGHAIPRFLVASFTFLGLALAATFSYQIIRQGIKEATAVPGAIQFGTTGANPTPAFLRSGNVTTFYDTTYYSAPIIAGGGSSSNWAAINAPGIQTSSYVYSYGPLCTNNASASCNMSGGVGMYPGAFQGTPGVAIAGTGTSYFNAGNVGIGTTNPSGKLEIYNASGWSPENSNPTPLGGLIIKNSASTALVMGIQQGTPYNGWIQVRHGTVAGNSYPLSLQPIGGNVGIGISDPKAVLHTSLSASGLVPMLYSHNTLPQFPRTLQNVSASITTNDTTVATGPVIGLNLENSSITNGTYSPLITFSRRSASNSYNTIYASIGGYAVGSGGDTNWTSGDLTFGTAQSNGYGPLERMRISASGNVGINTASPLAKLDVVGMTWVRDSVSTGATAIVQGYNSGALFASMTSGYPVFIGGSNNFYALTVMNSVGNSNVGIGTTGPTQKLDVAGNVQVTGNIVSIPTNASLVTDAHVTVPRTTAGFNQIFNKYNAAGAFIFRRVPNAGSTSGYNDLLNIDNAGTVVFNGAYSAVGSGTSQIYWTPGEGLTFRMNANNGTNVHMENLNGVWRLINSPWNLEMAKVSQTGDLTIGSQGYKPGGGSWAASSDRRVKRDINSFTDGLSVLEKINPVNYTYNGLAGNPAGYKSIGVIAQDIQPVAPYTVSSKMVKLNPTDKDLTKVLYFDPSALTYININATKELNKKVEDLTIKLDAQQKEIDELKKIVKDLQEKIGK